MRTNSGRLWITVGYYLATPLFAILDLIFGVNIRAAGLQGLPSLRTFYYSVCTIVGIVTFFRPSLSWIAGLAESSINILILILGVLLPYYALFQQVEGDRAFRSPFSASHIMNFLISGLIWANVFYRSAPPGPGGTDIGTGTGQRG